MKKATFLTLSQTFESFGQSMSINNAMSLFI